MCACRAYKNRSRTPWAQAYRMVCAQRRIRLVLTHVIAIDPERCRHRVLGGVIPLRG